MRYSQASMEVRVAADTTHDATTAKMLFCAIVPLLGFCAPRIVLRAFLGSVAEIVGATLALILLGTVFVLVARAGPRRQTTIAGLAAFCVVSVAWMIQANVKLTIALPAAVPYLIGIGGIAVADDEKTINRLLIGLVVVQCVNLILVVAPPAFLADALMRETTWTGARFETMESRATGLSGSPGELALTSAAAFALGLVQLARGHRLLGGVAALAALATGAATLNRSFVVAVAAVPIVLLLALPSIRGLWRVMSIGAPLLALGSFLLLKDTTYLQAITSRFDEEVISQAEYERTYGESGTYAVFEAALENPILGAIAYNPKDGSPAVILNGELLRPHNGVAAIAGTRGLVLGAVFVFWTILAWVGLFRRRLRRKRSIGIGWESPVLAAFTMGQIISITDSFLETGLMLLFLGLGLGARSVAPPDRAGESVGDSRA